MWKIIAMQFGFKCIVLFLQKIQNTRTSKNVTNLDLQNTWELGQFTLKSTDLRGRGRWGRLVTGQDPFGFWRSLWKILAIFFENLWRTLWTFEEMIFQSPCQDSLAWILEQSPPNSSPGFRNHWLQGILPLWFSKPLVPFLVGQLGNSKLLNQWVFACLRSEPFLRNGVIMRKRNRFEKKKAAFL